MCKLLQYQQSEVFPPHKNILCTEEWKKAMSRCWSSGDYEQHPVFCDPASLHRLLCLRQTAGWILENCPLRSLCFQLPPTFSFHRDFLISQCKFTLARSALIIIHTPCRVERLIWCCEKYCSSPCVVTCTASPERIFIGDFSCNIVRRIGFSQDWQSSGIFSYLCPWKCLFLLPFAHGSKFVLSGTILTTLLVFSLHMLWPY